MGEKSLKEKGQVNLWAFFNWLLKKISDLYKGKYRYTCTMISSDSINNSDKNVISRLAELDSAIQGLRA